MDPRTTFLSSQVKASQYKHPHCIICSLKWIKTATQTDTAVTDSHLHLENLMPQFIYVKTVKRWVCLPASRVLFTLLPIY